jgi:SH3 domain protein
MPTTIPVHKKENTLRIPALFLLMSLIIPTSTLAQEVRYVSDKQFVPLRSGAGNEYRILHRGLPSGTRLTIKSSSANGEWTEVTTDSGKSGWIPKQYLMAEVPAKLRLKAAEAQTARTGEQSAGMVSELEAVTIERDALFEQLTGSDLDLETVSRQLQELKQVSGKSVQLDVDNRRLVEESENLRSEVEMLEAETIRLQDKLKNEDFMNGALAVLLGVIIALVAPRLVPKRRKTSSWA